MRPHKPIVMCSLLLLAGCATQYQAGVGYEVNNPDSWNNPVGIVGVSYPLTEHIVIDYRHVSSLGGPDYVTSDAVALLFQFKGSDLAGR